MTKEDNYIISTRNLIRALVKVRAENHQDMATLANNFKEVYKSESEERKALLGLTVDETIAEAIKDFGIKECKFCKLYENAQELDLRYDNDQSRFKAKYFVKLYKKHWNKVSKQYVGSMTYEEMALKYCPLCGKKLTR